SLATGLIINQTNTQANTSVVVKIVNRLFSQSECFNSCNNENNFLLLYILVDDPYSTIHILVNQTNFSSASFNPGWAAENGMVWVRVLSSKDSCFEFSEVQFLSNKFQLYNFKSMLHISSYSYNTSGKSSRVRINSCTFLNNYVNRIAFFEGDVYLDVINTDFYGNNADYILFVAYSWDRSSYFITTTLKIEQSTFSNNTGGQLILLTGSYLLVNITGLQITNNILLSGSNGLIVFKNYDNLIANVTNVKHEFNYIAGEGSEVHFTSANLNAADSESVTVRAVNSFVICIPPNFQVVLPLEYLLTFGSDMCFDGSFQLFSIMNSSFSHNIGGGHGAAVYFNYAMDGLTNTTISTCTFNNNSDYKSLIYASSKSSVDAYLIVQDSMFMQNKETVFYIRNQTLQFSNDNKTTVFDSNRAQNGAALYLDLNAKIIFTNNSAVSFSNNIARRYGGAIYCDITQSSDACYR
ncbi:MAG: hypothetical protein OXG81_03930, partial [Acidobacteria bacterium]|nr:hypothetical protein [Acidobacteriota bacterium]